MIFFISCYCKRNRDFFDIFYEYIYEVNEIGINKNSNNNENNNNNEIENNENNNNDAIENNGNINNNENKNNDNNNDGNIIQIKKKVSRKRLKPDEAEAVYKIWDKRGPEVAKDLCLNTYKYKLTTYYKIIGQNGIIDKKTAK